MPSPDLLGLLTKFRNIGDCEFDGILYKTHTPHVAPLAYHTVVFKPVPAELRERRARELALPPSLQDFYERYNGLVLFGGAIRVYGLRPDEYLLERSDWFRKALPVDIVEVNQEHSHALAAREWVCFGDYCHDLSLICMERPTGRVVCVVESDFRRWRHAWASLDEWLVQEARRLSGYFDEAGVRLVDEELTLPTSVQ